MDGGVVVRMGRCGWRYPIIHRAEAPCYDILPFQGIKKADT